MGAVIQARCREGKANIASLLAPTLWRLPGPRSVRALRREWLTARDRGRHQYRFCPLRGFHGNRSEHLLGRFNDLDPRERQRQCAADSLPDNRRAQERYPRHRRDPQRLAPADRREQRLAQKLGELAPRIRPALSERRRIAPRPDTAPVRHDDDEPTVRRKNAPDLAQEIRRVIRRSIEASGSGSSVSSTRALRHGSAAGQRITPCRAGMNARVRSASSLKRPR